MGALSEETLGKTEINTTVTFADNPLVVAIKSFCEVFISKVKDAAETIFFSNDKVMFENKPIEVKIEYSQIDNIKDLSVQDGHKLTPADVGFDISQLSFVHTRSKDDFDLSKVSSDNLGLVSSVNKPDSGLWGSKLDIKEHDSGNISISAWQEQAPGMSLHEEVYTYGLKEDANILIIDNQDDYIAAIEKYETTDTFSKLSLDFEGIAKDFDGIYITENAIGDCYELSYMEHSALNYYDVDSLIIFNSDCVDEESIVKIKDEDVIGYSRDVHEAKLKELDEWMNE